jgi:hypothetical protein
MAVSVLLWTLIVLAAAGSAGAAPAADRLERFRELALSRLAVVENTGTALDPAVQGEIDAILDGEVLDSLRAGRPYASAEFIRERLDPFGDAWGGASLRVQSLGEGLLLGRFRLSARGVGSSVRLYGPTPEGAALLRAWTDGGVPEVYRWSNPPGGGIEFLVTWSGEAGPHSWPLRLEVWRVREGRLTPRWRSSERYPDGLWVSNVEVSPGRLFLRRELRYPGWKPGCDVQAEEEDRYRADANGGLALTGHQVFNGWHRDLQRSATRFFAALAAGDRRTLAELVPDAALRARLPSELSPEPACDARNPDTPGTAVVAAAVPLPTGGHAPWSLWWGRSARGWRLTGAAPVLE